MYATLTLAITVSAIHSRDTASNWSFWIQVTVSPKQLPSIHHVPCQQAEDRRGGGDPHPPHSHYALEPQREEPGEGVR
ncbi:hypothetical protein KRP22_002446 [Phytophthora ramorum]|uniref:uncharacterized protein n=1 Tax=Phytophthora ramorum TaxID=164328 RepID=UPI0030A683AE|nr:hypothetical protein KRP23_980 [Phytophthora ramorum]KAH7503035.1 hypothetical protein KRP22_6094 [Phytophthora ramorum]KAH7510146.1 hypothetical protein KRP22_1639 [Phytophthora ramorum]